MSFQDIEVSNNQICKNNLKLSMANYKGKSNLAPEMGTELRPGTYSTNFALHVFCIQQSEEMSPWCVLLRVI